MLTSSTTSRSASESPRFSRGSVRLRTELSVLAVMAVTVAGYRLLPAAFWILPFAFAAGYLALRFRALTLADRRWLLMCAASAFLLQISASLVRQPYDPTGTTEWRDDENYFRYAKMISEAWQNGNYPELSRKGPPPHLGSLHTGYERILGAVFYVGGSHVWGGLVANAVCLALLPVLCFFLSLSLFGKSPPFSGNGTDAEFAGRVYAGRLWSPAHLSSALCLFYPSLYYWGSMLLKDVFLATVFALTLLLLIDSFRLRSPSVAAGFLLMFFWTAIFRNYAALSLLAATFVYAFAGLRRGTLFWGLAWSVIIILGIGYTDWGGRYIDQLLSSLLNQLPRNLSTMGGVVRSFAEAVPRFLFSPYAWVRAEGENPFYALYPGMWYLYLLVYPLALAGLVQVIRMNHHLSIIPITAGIASSFVLLTAYGGNAPRQRLYLEIMLMVFAGAGFSARDRRIAFPATYTVIILFAALQLLRLYIRR